jgi:toxin secretion/phage lysis holin
MDKNLKLAAVVAGAVTSYFFGGWNGLLDTLLFLAALDYASGFTAAAIRGELSSSVGARGFAKKVFMFLVIAAAYRADLLLWNKTTFRDGATWGYIVNEFLSLIENAGRIGVPVPKAVRQAVAVLRRMAEGFTDTALKEAGVGDVAAKRNRKGSGHGTGT